MSSALWGDWRLEFMASHPALFRIRATEPQLSPGYPLCQAGWRNILERLCGRIENALRADEAFEFVRIRQKLGILRVSWNGKFSESTTILIERAVDLALARSASTCEICGAQGRLHNHRRWLSTRCADHAVGSAVAAPLGLNIATLNRPPSSRTSRTPTYDWKANTLTDVSLASRSEN